MTQQTQIGHVMLEDVRLAFAQGLWTASQVQGQGRPTFAASFIFPQSHPATQVVWNAMLATARAKWGGEGDATFQALAAGGRICLRDGDSKPTIPGFPGNYFVSARSPYMPLVIDGNRQPLTQASGKPYSGCYVNAKLAIWAQSNQHGKRINAQLQGVQFLGDGEPLAGGGVADAEEFGVVEQAAQAGAEFGAVFGGALPQSPPGALPSAPQVKF